MCNLERSITVSEINLPSLQHPTPKPKINYFFHSNLFESLSTLVRIYLDLKFNHGFYGFRLY